ncbi:MAG TPA: 16S rRNA (adenine(1518)-N(6)/adenine(1519)-N(6))-dimethyltransferase RsmA [Blastocatellia bacterium]|nr:16S rRNA (adenine(1518)-N(6)/adenine(1519)-N(6))-dimethyltransferase RsmA [Blastocatellia bacterium]
MIKAKKSLGQNFLIDKNVSRRIVESVSPQKGDLIIEIGPGTGALTHLLTEFAGRVIAFEIDTRLVEGLRLSLSASNLEVIEADALDLDWKQFLTGRRQSGAERLRVRVVANLPYYISTAILQKLIEQHDLIFDMTLMLQTEVVERIAAAPGGRDYGYLSVLVQYYSEAGKLFDVPPSAFRPAPKVNSAVVRLVMRERPPVEVSSEDDFFALVRAAFAQRRKTILNNLKAAHARLAFNIPIEQALEQAKIDSRTRAEALSLADFAALHRAMTRK